MPGLASQVSISRVVLYRDAEKLPVLRYGCIALDSARERQLILVFYSWVLGLFYSLLFPNFSTVSDLCIGERYVVLHYVPRVDPQHPKAMAAP